MQHVVQRTYLMSKNQIERIFINTHHSRLTGLGAIVTCNLMYNYPERRICCHIHNFLNLVKSLVCYGISVIFIA